MAPKTKQQHKEQKLEKRELILNTALEVFATHGYHGASISTIAQHAGIAKGLLYTYFESKEELLKAILNEGIIELMNYFMPYIKEEITSERFGILLKQYFTQLKSNADFWRLYFSIAMQPKVAELLQAEFSGIVGPYTGLLEKFYETQGSTNAKADAMLAHALIDGITLNYIMAHPDFDMEMVENIVIEKLSKPSY